MKTETITIRLEAETVKELQKMARTEDRTISYLARKMILEALEKGDGKKEIG